MNKTVMEKQVSALNTFWIVEYLKDHYPDINFADIINEVNKQQSYYVENLYTGAIELISMAHLKDTAYWFSNLFMIHLYEVIHAHVPDPALAYNIGKTAYKSQHILKTAIGIPLLGPYRILERIARENRKYNRTKEMTIIESEEGRVVIRLVHHGNVITNRFAMEWHAGIFEAYAGMSGATRVLVKSRCVEAGPEKYGDPGHAIWDFEIQFQYHNLIQRLFLSFLSNLPVVKTIIEDSNRIQEEYNEQILNRDQIIRDKTEMLKAIQNRIFAAERKSIEQKLQMISAELVATEEKERRLIAEDLHDSVSQSLAISLSKIKQITETGQMNDEKELSKIEKSLEQAVSDLRSLTFQISPPILYNLGLEASLKWLITDINNQNRMEIILNNHIRKPANLDETLKIVLYRSIRELIINIVKHAQTRRAQVTLSVFEDQFTGSVEDDGVGFDMDKMHQKDPVGFGLFSIGERIKTFGGEMEIDSSPGKGSNIMIVVPFGLKME